MLISSGLWNRRRNTLVQGINTCLHACTCVQVSPTLPTISLITDGAVLKEVSQYNPVIRIIKFTPNAVDVRRTYQQCFIALNPNLPFQPSTQVCTYLAPCHEASSIRLPNSRPRNA